MGQDGWTEGEAKEQRLRVTGGRERVSAFTELVFHCITREDFCFTVCLISAGRQLWQPRRFRQLLKRFSVSAATLQKHFFQSPWESQLKWKEFVFY